MTLTHSFHLSQRRIRLLASLLLLPGLRAAPRPAEPHPGRGEAGVAIAAAANLVYALDALNAEYRKRFPATKVKSTTGASGSLFAQIRNGAPFDVFMSADTDFPTQLGRAGLGDPSTLRTFAVGRLVAWTTRPDLNLSDLAAAVRSPSVAKIAIAQPQTAPYGRAAQAALEQLGVAAVARRKFVVGESVTQTAQFIETGNADLGFVALSLVQAPRLAGKGKWIEIPPTLYASVPLEHAAILTNRGARNPAARQYLEFLGSEPARKILREFGYR